MKNLVFLPLLLVLVLCFGAESSSASIKIGVVDMDSAFSEYDRAEGISEKVREIARKGLRERENLRKEIGLLERELREKAETLSDSEVEQKRSDIQRKILEYREFDRVQKERETEPVHEALKYIYQIIDAYAEENGFDLILEKRMGLFGRSVLFASEQVDITEEIAKLL